MNGTLKSKSDYILNEGRFGLQTFVYKLESCVVRFKVAAEVDKRFSSLKIQIGLHFDGKGRFGLQTF